jgi:hypothetical protein
VLTDLLIQKLKPPDKREEVPDGRIRGLYLVLQPSGARSWAVRYRVGGTPRKLTLGPYPEVALAAARRRAQEALGELAGGKDPAAMKQAAKAANRAAARADDDKVDKVVKDFADRYLKRHVGAGWARESERLLRVEIVPKLGGRRLGDVKRADVLDILDDIVDRGAPIGANRTLAALSRLCNWAVERGIIAASPCDKLKAPAAENERDWFWRVTISVSPGAPSRPLVGRMARSGNCCF